MPRFDGARRARGDARGAAAGAHRRLGRARRARRRSTRDELRALGLPWSPELVERARRSVGATLEAPTPRSPTARAPTSAAAPTTRSRTPAAASASSTTSSSATRALRGAGSCGACSSSTSTCTRATARTPRWPATTRRSRSRSTACGNYPFRRVPGDLERDLPRGTGDDAYLDALAELLPQAIARARAELCFYLAGADPFAGDRLGRLALTHAGLAARDRLVRSSLLRAGIPVCVTLAGGYAERIEDTVAINLATLRALRVEAP